MNALDSQQELFELPLALQAEPDSQSMQQYLQHEGQISTQPEPEQYMLSVPVATPVPDYTWARYDG